MTAAIIILTATALAQRPQVREEMVNGRAAWVLDNGVIRVAALKGGGHLAEVRFVSGDARRTVNPMRVPHYPTIDPHTYSDSKHDALYGTGTHKWLSSGYMGHLLCFPFYGPPSSEDEAKAMLGNHGEAPIVEWRQMRIEQSADQIAFWYGADLTRTGYRVERAIRLGRDARHFTVWEFVRNLANYDRPFQWMQHATFGPPFVEPGKLMLDASATRGTTGTAEFHWPRGIDGDGKPVDLRPMTAVEKSGGYTALLLDPSRREQFFTLFNPAYPVLIGYLFPSDRNPWLADWQENRRNAFAPWNNQVIARGLEFGNSPFAEGLRKAVDRGSLFGVPSYQWIGARQGLRNEFTVFLDEIPAGFAGVRDARMEDGRVRLVTR